MNPEDTAGDKSRFHSAVSWKITFNEGVKDHACREGSLRIQFGYYFLLETRERAVSNIFLDYIFYLIVKRIIYYKPNLQKCHEMQAAVVDIFLVLCNFENFNEKKG